MKHATQAALQEISGLLEAIRTKPGLKEKSLGVFYRKAKWFLHFHEDPAGLFADLATGPEFERLPVNSQAEWDTLLRSIDRLLAPAAP